MAPYFTIQDGKAVPVDRLPDLSNIQTNLDGLCYCAEEKTLPDGRKSLKWEQCKIFTPVEIQEIDSAALIMERLFGNVSRLEATSEAFEEYKTELGSTNEPHARALVDRRYRAFILEWRLFLDHWRNYILGGAQTKYWSDKTDAEKYTTAYLALYDDLLEEAEKTDEFVVAWAIRNHVAHADNAIDWLPIDESGARAYISRDALIERCNSDKRAAWQKDALARQDEMIDLTFIGEKAMEATNAFMEGMIEFQIDTENADAALTLLHASERIRDAGIFSDRWMIFYNQGIRWMEQPVGKLQRAKDENGNPVDEEPKPVSVMVPGMILGNRELNWKGYLAVAGYFGHLYQSGKWKALQEKYLTT